MTFLKLLPPLLLFVLLPWQLALADAYDAEIDKIVAKMKVAEEVRMVGGNDPCTNPIPRLHIPALCVNDGPMGVRMGPMTAFPSGTAVASSFDDELSREMGAGIGDELRTKQYQVILGPTVNINRNPFGGRGSESYGEDPLLTANMASAYVKGVQSKDVLACVKHFIGNDQEYERYRVNVTIDERTLNEIYYPPFKAAVEANVGCLMSAYNKINGFYSSENAETLQNELRDKWQYQGFVISDWGGTHSTVAAANAGLDLEMPKGQFFGSKLLEAVKSGEVPKANLDKKVKRLLRAMYSTHLLGTASKLPKPLGPESHEHQNLAEKIAEESAILLFNEGILPLKSDLQSIAILGPNAAVLRTGEGGSSHVTPYVAVSPLDALRDRLGSNVKIFYEPGTSIPGDSLPAIPTNTLRPEMESSDSGLKMEFFNNTNLQGKPAKVTIEPGINKTMRDFTDSQMQNGFSIRWSGYVLAPATGEYRFSMDMMDGARLLIDDKLVADSWGNTDPAREESEADMTGNAWHKIVLEYHHAVNNTPTMTNIPPTVMILGMATPDPQAVDRAVDAARKAQVTVIFAGLGNEMECEGADRESLDLPEDQLDLIKRVVEANPNTLVVLNSGSPINLQPWSKNVKALVQQFYPGEGGGKAMARLLAGDVNFSGKLPVTILDRWEDSCAYGTNPSSGLQITYSEGINVGYRCHESKYPFGFGLSYTQFSFQNIRVTAMDTSINSPKVQVDFEVTNTGNAAGTEVAQLYVGEVNPKLPRPTRELKAYKRVNLNPGETKKVVFELDRTAFEYYNPEVHAWVVDPNQFTISVGNSSREKDLHLQTDIALTTAKNP